ncbi:MAG: DUF1015 domain-containing protein [Candidatus Omnitrophica bacterium]|nr:DUF1015 domain-containing protein [Candidatus Omnitrophota bacterium]
MAIILPFRGWRYNPEKIGDISAVVAPPYDIISPAEQASLYARHPHNVIRLILNKVEAADSPQDNRYTRAGALFARWRQEGVLAADPRPAVYLYIQDYRVEGCQRRRLGFIARFQFEDGNCLPHEHTLAKPKEDRRQLMKAVDANLSPIFSFFQDKDGRVGMLLKQWITKKPGVDITDAEGVRHRFWVIDDPERIAVLRRCMRRKQIFIADGHHRFETALAYRDELRRRGKAGPGHNSIMMFFTALNDENLYVMPTHRLVKPVPDRAEKMKQIDTLFSREVFKSLTALLAAQRRAAGFAVGMYDGKQFMLLQMKDRATLNTLMSKAPAQWRQLDVAMLNSVVFEHIFRLSAAQKEELISYARDAEDAVRQVDAGDFALAFFPNPTRAEQVEKIARQRFRMPQKSTYFYPKPLSGLVINRLTE